jgi:hypothetical protein
MGFGASGATSLLHDGERAAVNSHTRRNATCAPPRTLASDNAENGGGLDIHSFRGSRAWGG